MSEQPPPEKPKPKHINHLQSEPVPMSFASPQFLAQVTAGNFNALSMPQSKMPGYSPMPMGTGGYDKVPTTYHAQPPQQIASNNATSGSVASAYANNVSTSSAPKLLTGPPSQTIDIANGTFQWEVCGGQDERCINYIRDECANKLVFLMTSGGLGQKVVPEVHNLPQVYCIYIYCANVKFHSEWSKKYSKVRVVCDNDDLYLLPQFAVDVAQVNIDWSIGLFKAGNREKAKEKLKLASDKLNNYARNHDPAMDAEIKKKLDECQ